MNCKKVLRNALVLCLCVMLFASFMQASAGEVTLSVKYIPIEKYGFVADTFNGVQAKYNPWGTNYDCGELIHRYITQLYGLDITLTDQPRVVGTDEYWFVQVEEPRPGDVFCANAWERGKAYGHWAICKSVDKENGTITMFEQNWRWNGTAGVDRQIPYEGNCYRYYRLTNAADYVLTLEEQAQKQAEHERNVAQMLLQQQEEDAALQAEQEHRRANMEIIQKAVAEKKANMAQLRENFQTQAEAIAQYGQ